MSVKCGCGRSPTGECVGWHLLTPEEFDVRDSLYREKRVDLKGNSVPLGKKCGCGRSPTGYCIGWHSLTQEDFEVRQEGYLTGKTDLKGKDIK